MTTPSDQDERPLRLIVGLGNPGPEYQDTRHNVGFRVVEALAERLGTLFRGPSRLNGWDRKPRGFQWARSDAPRPAFLLKPGTYMNCSGDIVAPVARWLASRGELASVLAAPEGDVGAPDPAAAPLALEPDPSSILVVYDDMDLDVGRLRLRPHGGHGGQNGMRSILNRLCTDRFPRLRVGIGRTGTDAARHVLSPFTPDEAVSIEVSIEQSVDALVAWLDGETFEGVMTRFHSRWNDSL